MSSDDERQTVLRDLHTLIDAFFPTTSQVAATPGNAEAPLVPTVKPQKTLVDFFGGLKRKKEAPEEKKHEEPEPQQKLPPTPLSMTKSLLGVTAASKHPVFVRGGETSWNPKSINPPVKRIKREPTIEDASSSAKSKKKVAKLSQLPLLPIDILYEIFAHLPPLYLLYLSRTSKALRQLLMNRNSIGVWRLSLERVEFSPGLEFCPLDEEVNIPAWCALIFETVCQACATPNVRNADFFLRVRYCVACSKKLLLQTDAVRDASIADILSKYVARGGEESRWHNFWRLDEKLGLLKEMLEQKFLQADRSENITPSERADLEDRAVVFLQGRSDAVKKKKEIGDAWEDWVSICVQARTIAWREAKEDRERRTTIELIDLGYAEELQFLDDTPSRRLGKFRKLSAHPEIEYGLSWSDKRWNRMKPGLVKYMEEIRSVLRLQERMSLARPREAVVVQAYAEWRRRPENLERYPPNELVPTAADILEWDDIKLLIHNHSRYLTYQLVFDIFDGNLRIEYQSAIHRHIREWKNKVASRFEELIPHRLPNDVDDPWMYSSPLPISQISRHFILARATTVFRCTGRTSCACSSDVHTETVATWYRDTGVISTPNLSLFSEAFVKEEDRREWVMWYPEFLFHPCNTLEGDPERHIPRRSRLDAVGGDHLSTSEFKTPQAQKAKRTSFDIAPHSEFDIKASKCVQNLLSAAGRNLDTTAVEMDQANERFACLKCSYGGRIDGDRPMNVFHWRSAVQHSLQHHSGNSFVEWEMLHSTDTLKAIQLENVDRAKPEKGFKPSSHLRKWRCLLCRDTTHEPGRLSSSGLKRHFNTMSIEHSWHAGSGDDITPENLDKLYYMALDFSERLHPGVKMKPLIPSEPR